MSDTTENSSSNWSFDRIVGLVLATALFPIALVVSPRTARTLFQREVALNETADTKLFGASRCKTESTRLDPATIGKQLEQLAESQDWLAIGRAIGQWEASAEVSSVGAPVHELALTMLRWHLSDEVFPPNMCNFDAYFRIPNKVIAELERVVSINPDNHVLTGILAQFHIDRGWVARGGGWSEDVTKEGWDALQRSFHIAHGLLSRFDARKLRSPLLASVEFQLLVAVEEGRDATREAYELWSGLEPNSMKAHEHFAFMLLPRWFGDLATIDREARQTMHVTEHETGAAAYAAMYMTALKYDDDAFYRIDMGLLRQGLHDLIARDDNPAARAFRLAAQLDNDSETGLVAIWDEFLNRKVYRKMAEAKAIARELLEHYVAYRPYEEGSDQQETFLALVSKLWQKELKAGRHLRVGEYGIELVPSSSFT